GPDVGVLLLALEHGPRPGEDRLVRDVVHVGAVVVQDRFEGDGVLGVVPRDPRPLDERGPAGVRLAQRLAAGLRGRLRGLSPGLHVLVRRTPRVVAVLSLLDAAESLLVQRPGTPCDVDGEYRRDQCGGEKHHRPVLGLSGSGVRSPGAEAFSVLMGGGHHGFLEKGRSRRVPFGPRRIQVPFPPGLGSWDPISPGLPGRARGATPSAESGPGGRRRAVPPGRWGRRAAGAAGRSGRPPARGPGSPRGPRGPRSRPTR